MLLTLAPAPHAEVSVELLRLAPGAIRPRSYTAISQTSLPWILSPLSRS